MADNLVMASLNDLYKSSKSTTWRAQVLKKYQAIYGFLKQNNLLILVEPFGENGEIISDLVIRESNLTPVGLKLFEQTIPAWLKARDRDGNMENIESLINGLKKVQQST